MAEEAPAPAAKAAKKRASGARKRGDVPLPKRILGILADSSDRKGLSMTAIKRILGDQGVDLQKTNKRINLTLTRLVTNGAIHQVKGQGASGSFKLLKAEPAKKARKPAVRKSRSPSKVRKPAAKRSPAKKAAPKKATPKRSPAKKAAARKTTPKKAARKPKSPKKAKRPAAKRSPARKAAPKRKSKPKKKPAARRSKK